MIQESVPVYAHVEELQFPLCEEKSLDLELEIWGSGAMHSSQVEIYRNRFKCKGMVSSHVEQAARSCLLGMRTDFQGEEGGPTSCKLYINCPKGV